MADLKINGITVPTDGDIIQYDGSQWKREVENFSKVDGSRDFTAPVSYDTQPTFTDDLQIITKKYVDDQITALTSGSPAVLTGDPYVLITSTSGGLPVDSSGTDNILIGKNTSVSGVLDRNVVIGLGPTVGAGSDDNVVIGPDATIGASVDGGVVIGHNVSGTGSGCVVAGDGSTAGASGVAIGDNCDAGTGIAIGGDLTCSVTDGVVVGRDLSISGSDLVRIGYDTTYLNLTTSGVLSLSGTTAMFGIPNHSTSTINSFSVPPEGGVVYSTDANRPVYYDGSDWRYFSDDSVLS